MKTTFWGAMALCALAGTTQAQGFESADLGFQLYKYDEGGNIDTTFAVLTADASYLITPRAGVQVGLAYSHEVDVSQAWLSVGDTRAATIHAFVDPTDNARIGLMIGADSYNEGDYIYALEGTYVADRYRVEARVGRFESDIEPASLAEISTAFDLTGRLQGTGSYQRVTYDGGFGYFELAALGLGYDITDRLTGYASYGNTVNDFGGGSVFEGNQITLGVTMAIGGGQNPRAFTYNPFF